MMKIYLSYIVFNCAIPGFRCMIPSGDAKLTEEKSFVKDFATKEEKEKPFEVDFEPRPNLSVYND